MLDLHTPDTFITDQRQLQNAFAFCAETGANLIKSRRHPWYALIVPVAYPLPTGEMEMRHLWHRGKVLTDESAMVRAQVALDRMMRNGAIGQESER